MTLWQPAIVCYFMYVVCWYLANKLSLLLQAVIRNLARIYSREGPISLLLFEMHDMMAMLFTKKRPPAYHRRRSSVNFRGGAQNFCPKKMCIKNQQNARILHDSCPKNYQSTRIFYDICPKNLHNSRILHDFCPKMPEFYIIIARKIFFPEF